jgi:hypothetical protein
VRFGEFRLQLNRLHQMLKSILLFSKGAQVLGQFEMRQRVIRFFFQTT